METWFVKVRFCNGEIITTRMNGSRAQVQSYYAPGSLFNLGTVSDNMQKVDKILEMMTLKKDTPKK